MSESISVLRAYIHISGWFVCMHACMHACTCVYIYILICEHTYASMYVCICICVGVCSILQNITEHDPK